MIFVKVISGNIFLDKVFYYMFNYLIIIIKLFLALNIFWLFTV